MSFISEIKERGTFLEIFISNGSSFFVFPEDFSNMDVAPLRSGTDAAIERRDSNMDAAPLRSGTDAAIERRGSDKGLQIGGKVSAELLEKLEFLHNISITYKKAINIISFAPTTAFLLKQKLLKKGCDNLSIGKTIEKLSEKNLIDDRKFAEGWVSLRMSKNPASPFVLKSALMRKGVDRTTADEVLKDFTPASSLYTESFEKALSKQLRKANRPKDKIKMALLRKGYPLSLINKYLDN